MRRLSGLDAGFLILETPTAPMTIGSVSIIDPGTARGSFTVARLRGILRRRLDRAPALRRRLATLPFGLARPCWVELEAAEIDLERHVEQTTLPSPGGWRELSELVAWEISRPLERDRPLWQLLLVSGLESADGVPAGAMAIIARVHHATIDGVGGAEILAALCADEAGREGVGESVPAAVADDGAMGIPDLLARAGRHVLAAPLDASRMAGQSVTALIDSVRRLLGATSKDERSAAGVPPLVFSAPRTPLNQPLSGHRSWAPAILDLGAVKRVKRAAEATVNDVLLAVCSGALRGWLAERGELPEQPLVAMVPVSVRSGEEKREAGNLVSAMLVSLATDEPEARARLEKIRRAANESKAAHRAVGARTLLESAQLVPFALSGLTARLYSRWHLAARHRPMFNLVITNVRGPEQPLAVDGARMLAHLPAAPVFDGLGLILPIFSYAGSIAIGVTGDRVILPDAADFARRLEGAFAELEESLLGSRA